jgi:hypothetical protein
MTDRPRVGTFERNRIDARRPVLTLIASRRRDKIERALQLGGRAENVWSSAALR